MRSPRRILVIDDDPGIREFLSMVLMDEGYSLAVAEDGIVALSLLENFQPHLIFLDMLMPGMDGQHFLETYHTKFPDIPIIASSASMAAEKFAQTLGVADFLAKPFNLDDFFTLLHKHLPSEQHGGIRS